jgi:hypothetical protein
VMEVFAAPQFPSGVRRQSSSPATSPVDGLIGPPDPGTSKAGEVSAITLALAACARVAFQGTGGPTLRHTHNPATSTACP